MMQNFSGSSAVASPASRHAFNSTSSKAVEATLTLPTATRLATFAVLLLLVYIIYEQAKFYIYRCSTSAPSRCTDRPADIPLLYPAASPSIVCLPVAMKFYKQSSSFGHTCW